MKTSELKDAALDWAVSTITNPEWSDEDRRWNIYDYVDTGDEGDEPYSPSTIWAQGGPIIERECISVVPLHGAMWAQRRSRSTRFLRVTVRHITKVSARPHLSQPCAAFVSASWAMKWNCRRS